MSFNLLYPEKIIFGSSSINELPDLLPVRSKILLVTGKSAIMSGVADRIKQLLDPYTIIDAVGLAVPEPPLECVDKIIELGRNQNAEVVVAVGGGSAVDAAKVAAALIPAEGLCDDYFYGKRQIEKKGLFFVAVPTTAGTGSEITKNSVLTDSIRKIKQSIRSPYMVPDIAIVDPVLTLAMPPSLTAASGLDAFTQALESFTSSAANNVTRPLAKAAAAQIFANIAGAFKNGDDLEKRTAMAEASLMSAMAFSQSGLGAVHGLAHPIGSLLNVSHGIACSILLKPVMEWNAPVCAADYAEIAKTCLTSANPDDNDETLTEKLISAISSLCDEMNIPKGFSGFGLKKEHFNFIVKNCRSNSMKCNPRPMTDEDVIRLLENLTEY